MGNNDIRKHLGHVHIINRSGFKPKLCDHLVTLKKHQYHIVSGYSITGDAPKKFIRVYEPENSKKNNTKTWSLYIAKTGHKWYPGESITEYLLNVLGCKFGLHMSFSRLVIAGKQIRFLSKYFLNPKEQELIHGAEIFVGYMEDEEMIHQIEEKNQAREYFTITFVKSALDHICGPYSNKIFGSFIRMLIFDAWVGNNDRHFYNWGVIRHLQGNHEPHFAPIYDTARGLFWNVAEKKVIALYNNKANLTSFLNRYLKNSKPKTGIDGDPNVNHFQLLTYIYKNEIGITKHEVKTLISKNCLELFLNTVDKEFAHLLTKQRRWLIKECLIDRFKKIEEILNINDDDQ